MFIYKPLANEVSINSANSVVTNANVGVGCLLRIVNPSTTAVLHFQFANGAEYSNLTMLASSETVIWKNNTDLLIGSNMLASTISYKGI